MGPAKAAMMEYEVTRALSAGYLVRQGLLEQCEYHGEIIVILRAPSGISQSKEKQPIPWAAEVPAREFTDLLSEANGGATAKC